MLANSATRFLSLSDKSDNPLRPPPLPPLPLLPLPMSQLYTPSVDNS